MTDKMTGCRSSLIDVLSDATNTARELLSVLRDEYRALLARDSDALHTASTRKQTLVDLLNDFELERSKILEAFQFDDADTSMEQICAACDHDGQLAVAWETLIDLAHQAREANQENGAVLNVQRQRTLQALEILRGPATDSDVYGPAGITEQQSPQRFVVSV